VPGFTPIENYEPPDKGWGIVVGRLMPKPPEPEEQQADDADEQQPERDS
jgi:hypothetical protein